MLYFIVEYFLTVRLENIQYMHDSLEGRFEMGCYKIPF